MNALAWPTHAALATVAAVLACSCSSSSAPGPTNPSFRDVSEAPPAIQTAAKAVVRIQSAGEVATGVFVSGDGLLMTNNHVLGVDICPREGCVVGITIGFQRHAPVPTAATLFVQPVAVDVGLDMALVQVFADASGAGNKLSTPDHVTIAPRSVAELQGTRVHIVGHPEGRLKKWSAGDVIDANGDWFTTTAYILPGNSGSPILDDQGNMVGIAHRGPTSEDLFTSDGANEYSVGTASDSLSVAMTAPLPAVVRSTAASTTDADVVAHDFVYLNARTANAVVGGTSKPVLTSLGEACDAGLARTDVASPDDLAAALAPCSDAVSWIECRSDAPPGGFGVCPPDAAAWTSRFEQVNARFRALNGTLQLSPLSFGVAALASSTSAGIAAGGSEIQTALAAAKPPLDYSLAQYLAAFSVPSYGGTTTEAYVRGYAKTRDYQRQAYQIASAALWLNDRGVVNDTDTLTLLAPLASDPDVDIAAKLYVEEVQYVRNAIQ